PCQARDKRKQSHSMNRRTFIRTTTIGATSLAGLSLRNAFAAEKPHWPIGCFNRPWVKWSYDDALDGIAAAGYKLTGLLSAHKGAHANFKVWYDAGNIIYYTGKDPLAELEPIAQHVTGFCAKDCPEPKGEVMSQFGTGKVDFKAVFAKLKSVGFNGPIMVEGVKVSATPAETTENARANREFLEKVLASL